MKIWIRKNWFFQYIEQVDYIFVSFLFITMRFETKYHKEAKLRQEKKMEFIRAQIKQNEGRCCGRCDGVNDECVSDMNCKEHDIQGCETCFGQR